ncbi:hypothetical protein M3Y96_00757900 [Aphelenchoides besseyi]|nr:hypothetical protein M3Y96_00757900 [Aphelenchoides besseyi]
MEKFLFNPDFYNKFYNCSTHTPEEWHAFGSSSIGIAAIYIAIGLIFPCLYVMGSNRFLKLSCYKIMYFLGVIDVACIFINSILSGIFTYEGAVFCDHPTLMYISGGISTGLWFSACCACVLLALNRCCDLLRPNWMETLFGGSRTYWWLLVPTIYGLYFIVFTPPLIYTSIYNAAFFDPFTGTDKADAELYTSWGRVAQNMGHSTNRHGMSIIAQATLICALILIAATIYVRMQFFDTPSYMIIVGQVTWQSSHGGAVFIYLFLNRTMRREIMKSFFPNGFCSNRSGTVSTTQVAKIGGAPAFTSLRDQEENDESTRY